MVLTPYTEADAREQERRERRSALNVLSFQVEQLRDGFTKRGGVSHGLFERIVQSLLKIGRHIPVSPESADRFEQKLNRAGTGEFVVNMEGPKVFLSGYFEMDKIRREMLW